MKFSNGINWGIDLSSIKISEKDQMAPTLSMQLGRGKLPL
jgi:hypothetical protein